jgi:predicted transcriptional regulator
MAATAVLPIPREIKFPEGLHKWHVLVAYILFREINWLELNWVKKSGSGRPDSLSHQSRRQI